MLQLYGDIILIRIAHRGNITGANPEMENTIEYLSTALDMGYWIECDLQMYEGLLYFGHDEPQQRADNWILSHPNTICHAKDIEALHSLLDMDVHCFWHETDTVTLTSRAYIWCYHGQYPENDRAIWLDFLGEETKNMDRSKCFGICADDFGNIT